MNRKVAGFIFVLLTSVICVPAQELDKEITLLADRLGKSLVAKNRKKVAVVDFVDLQGRPTELGRFLAEQLSVELVNVPNVSVVDRANLKSIIAELKLSDDGYVSADSAKKLGKFAGVDAILIGTVTSLDDDVVLTVKAVSTETAELAAASKSTFRKTKELQQFSVHAVPGSGDWRKTTGDPGYVAVKEFGDFRIALKSIRRIGVPGNWGSTVDGIQCIFAFENKNLKDAMVFALNGQKPDSMSGNTMIRGQISDTSGHVWMAAGATGISTVRVAGDGRPLAIAETISRGHRVEAGGYGQPGDVAWVGELTSLAPGEKLEGAVTFSPRSDREGGVADALQLECELVIGFGSSTSKNYRLYSWICGNLSVSSPGK